jgi:GntR family carbon starvation induced transcriptional regulator
MTEDLSLTHRAYMDLRVALISCRLPPGSRLNIAKLQRDIGVSQAAVREALSRLTAEGFVVISRNSGFRAAPIAMDGYRELADAVLAIEEILLRASIARGDYAWEGALMSSYHVASRVLAEAEGDVGMDAYISNREEFHRKLFSACGNQWLLGAWSQLYAQQLRFRHVFADLARFEQGLHADYRDYLDAVIDRDVERALQLWRAHHDKIVGFIEDHLRPAAAPLRRAAARAGAKPAGRSHGNNPVEAEPKAARNPD